MSWFDHDEAVTFAELGGRRSAQADLAELLGLDPESILRVTVHVEPGHDGKSHVYAEWDGRRDLSGEELAKVLELLDREHQERR